MYMPDLSALPRGPASGQHGAIVLGGAHGALAVIRDLGRAGIPAIFLDHGHPIARYSRYNSRVIAWCGPQAPNAIEFLLGLAGSEHLGGWVLIPCADPEARLLSEAHASLSRVFRLPVTPWSRMQWAYDKKLLYDLAGRLELAFPRLLTTGQLARPATSGILYPVVIKPGVREQDNALARDKAWKAETPDELARLYQDAVELTGRDNIVVQEMIPGGGDAQFSYAGIWHEGAPVATLVARRTRQYPREFGFTSTFVETVDEPEVERAAQSLLRALDYTGLVEVEFKYDARDRRYKILDVNCRVWTWVGLGAAAGIDFGAILWRLASGERVEPRRAVSGVAWAHVSRDLPAALRGPHAAVPGPLAYVRELRRTATFAAWAADDPLPGLLDLPLTGPRLARRLWRKWLNLGDRVGGLPLKA